MSARTFRMTILTGLVLQALMIGADTLWSQALPQQTPLDAYVQKPDPSFSWKVVSAKTDGGINQVVLAMTSQNWLSAEKVNRTEWQHWMVLAYPDKVRSNIGFLMIGGGSNNDPAPAGADDRTMQIAKATGTLVAELKMVPNQPLIFHNDGQSRTEDDLIGYTWDQFLKTGDPEWTARNAMVKSAVRAMDAMTAYMASDAGGKQTVDQFVVAGGSKRGWTTWLTGAVDQRVVGIIPIVIDVVNVDTSMRHHFAAYGFWAPAIGNYIQHSIMQRMDHPRLKDLYAMEDPMSYKDRLTMPKLILNAAGDQFFLPDSSQFYWTQLKNEKALRYIPNADHGLKDTDAAESIVAFYSLILAKKPLPRFEWSLGKDGLTINAKDRPEALRLWQANNPEARDFRMETLGKKYTSQSLELPADGKLAVQMPAPEKGWTAYFVEATYDVGAPTKLKLTTAVHVVPDSLPFANKNPSLPTTLTIVAQASEKAPVAEIEKSISILKGQGKFPKPDTVKVEVRGDRCYVNWTGDLSKMHAEAGALAKFLQERGCKTVHFQIESGETITLPPAPPLP
jgi:PhoPQ-activated pathogenicity-related protein